MAFIETVNEDTATDGARALYDRQRARYGYVPNYAKAFSHRPEVMQRWAELLSAIKRNLDKRRFELATFAAAHALRSTLCTLAHGKALTEFFSADDVRRLALGDSPDTVTPAETALMEFARKVAIDASAITRADVDELRRQGLDDADIFDIAATAAGRAFFTKVIESLGVEADAPFRSLAADLRDALAVGRPVDFCS